MGLYAFFLAGSNYFAPVICGFIAEYQGWQWVFYWPAIFCAVAAAFLFFFMEETNYAREHVGLIAPTNSAKPSDSASKQVEQEKPVPFDTPRHSDSELGEVHKKKTYTQKLSLLGPRQPKNHMLRRLWHGVYYLSWPIVFYAG
jgi:MFS family permease